AAPLFAGIHAGDPEKLSVRSTFPRLSEMERSHGSLAAALRAGRRGGTSLRPSGPPFASFRGGIRRLVEALETSLKQTRMETRREVVRIERRGPSWTVRTRDGGAVDADACILALPAGDAAGILEASAPRSAAALRRVRYASSATVFLGYRSSEAGKLP